MKTLQILEKLIRHRTVTGDHAACKRSLDWIVDQVDKVPLVVRRFESGGFYSLILTTQKTKRPRVWLAGHLDVVPGSVKLFHPRREKNRLYGRGSIDMKFAIASYIAILTGLGRAVRQYNLGVMITTDEEIGGFNGTKKILESGYGGDFCILPDGGGDWKFEKSAKGVLQLRVESRGKSHHGARTWLGDNAIQKLAEFLHELSKLFPSEPCRVRDHYHPTLNIGEIRGGEGVNRIPDFAEARLDVRFPSSYTIRDMQHRIRQLAKRYRGIVVEEVISAESFSVVTDDPYYQTFMNVAKRHTGKKSFSFIRSHGSSDARYFAAKGIPVLLTRPYGAGLHSEDEWVDIESMELFSRVLGDFIRQTTVA